ncbi:protein phosphatase 2C domain-containing protein [Pseudanabaena catenata USMAC16]|uniref:Protein serine/threonine phosphatase n=3 Tax=Pseudanabaena TaxID=1152 RepID=L8N019_9CYAN|nr:protein phosphatase 2C domain-containing protein [Pseudanabaena catenata]ELS31593.1 protein serine/threonine phosphatase [Pseudanabaena biceps PCC 7429]MDG3496139.1 protein phosphatase 2C domain-containing protein [Pseudanabaena catenata USMAC16]
MIICPSCKVENPDSYQFCQSCGTKVSAKIAPDIALNILGDEAIKPSSNPTKPLNLESMLGDIKIQVKNLTSSQTIGQITGQITGQIANEAVAGTDESSLCLEPDLALKVEDPRDISADLSTIISSARTAPVIDASGQASPICLQDIIYGGKTDAGMQRDRNEDDFVTIFQSRSAHGKSQASDRSQHGLFVLCDGMGGHDGGEEASAIVINSISEQFQPFWMDTLPGENKLKEIIRNANQAIFVKNEEELRLSLGRMGTTLVMLAIHDLEVVIAHVGDSRIYKVTDSPKALNVEFDGSEKLLELDALGDVVSDSAQLQQLTRDHEVLNQLLDLGMDLEEALARPDVHQLTQALGPNPSDDLEPSIQFLSLTESTLFLLCSDGLCDHDVIEENWRSHLLPILHEEIDLKTGLDNLMELGNNVNGHDNLTAILILCKLLPSQ